MAASSAPQSEREIAFLARFYRPGKTASHVQLYTCNLNGEQMRRWSSAPVDVLSARWLGRKKLQYWTPDENFPGRARAWIIDLNRSKTTRAGLSDLNRLDVRRKVDGFVDPFSEESNQQGPKDIPSTDPLDDAKWLAPSTDGLIRIWKRGKVTVTRLDANLSGYSFDKSHNRLWLFTWTSDSTIGVHQYIELVDWKAAKPRDVITNVNVVDFQPSRTVYTAISCRDLTPISSSQSVWTSQLILGNWQTGAKKAIVKGLVYVKDVWMSQ